MSGGFFVLIMENYMTKPLISYTIPLLNLDALRKNEFHLSRREAGFFERLGKRAIRFNDVFDALLALAFICARADLSPTKLSSDCISGIRVALHDLIALAAALPAKSEEELVRKIVIDRFMAQGNDNGTLSGLLAASVRLDIERLDPNFSIEDVELWMEAKRSRSDA
jgi:hypothetical protein